MTKAKYSISDDQMRELLEKYPFLCMQNNSYTDDDCIYRNWYKAWDGTGWESLWKKYVSKVCDWYDSISDEDKLNFHIIATKEKLGSLRVYVSGGSEDHLEDIVEWLSSVTCSTCGKVTRDGDSFLIWRTGGWITNFCEECARKHVREYADQDRISDLKMRFDKFGYTKWSHGRISEVVEYTDDGAGWLKKMNLLPISSEELND